MEPTSLHLVSQELAQEYVSGLAMPVEPSEIDLFRIGADFARYLSDQGATFCADGLSLTAWEARVDRGLSMLLRPPSRLFADAGLPIGIARDFPIRLDLYEGAMGGCYLPARLIAQAIVLLDRNLDRSVKRMAEAEMDAVRLQGRMLEAVHAAGAAGHGLFEALGVVISDEPSSWPSGQPVLTHPTDRDFRNRIELALKPPEEPGALMRLLGRFGR